MLNPVSPVEQFAALTATGVCGHAFVGRVEGIDVRFEKTEVLRRLDAAHRDVRQRLGLSKMPFVTAQQVHGSNVAVIDQAIPEDQCFDGCDGIVTDQRGLCLGIYVADCCAVYLLDPIRKIIGLAHSGRKGTELGIVPQAISVMTDRFAARASDIIAQLSPCIRPPHYEVDFAAEIVKQCCAAGLDKIYDSGVCTARDLEDYYSYRAEKARTGRMVALLALR